MPDPIQRMPIFALPHDDQVEFLIEKTQADFGVAEFNSNTPVYILCKRCGETFLRPYAHRLYQHDCRDRVFTADIIESLPRLEYKLLHPLATPPRRSRITDAADDITSVEQVIINPGHTTHVHTGIAISAPPQWYYRIEGRSSLAIKGITPFQGVIDAGYCNEIIIILTNDSQEPYEIKIGDRIAQIILHRIKHCDLVEVKEFSHKYKARDQSGFGSSGR